MKQVEVRNLKKGQVILIGDINGKFDVAKIRNIVVHVENWEKIDKDSAVVDYKGDGDIEFDKISGEWFNVLSQREVKKVDAIKFKIKMLDGLKEKK